MRKFEDERKIVSDAVERVKLQRETWKHLPMEKQVELGLQSLGNALDKKGIKLACGINFILSSKASEEKDEETKLFLSLMASEAGRRVLRYE